MKVDVPFVNVKLQPKDTIDGLLKLYNRHDLRYVQLVQLRHLVYVLNKKDIFSLGDIVKIPIVCRNENDEVDENGNSIRNASNSIEYMRAINKDVFSIDNYKNPISNINDVEDISIIIRKTNFVETIKSKIPNFVSKLKKENNTTFKEVGGIEKIKEIRDINKINIESKNKKDVKKDIEETSVKKDIVIEGLIIPEIEKDAFKKSDEYLRIEEIIDIEDDDTIKTVTEKIMTALNLPNRTLNRFKRTSTYKDIVKIFKK